MPDFNFAKGNRKRDEGTSSASEERQSTGQQRPVSAHPQGGLPDAMASGPERSPRPGQGNPVPGSSTAQPSRGSVLDKYPERDLSRLAGAASGTPPPTGMAQTPGETDPIPDDPLTTDIPAGDESPAAAERNMSTPSSKGPLIAFLTIAALLIIVAFIWHLNPWPSLKDRIAGIFGADKRETVAPPTTPPPAAVEDVPEPTMRAWDFFLQVSSWKELGQADLDAERYRAQGFDAIVESEFIPTKGGTWYRVRLGPYESSSAAREILTANAGVLPKGVYLDSVRLTEEQPIAAPQTKTAKSGAPRTTGIDESASGSRRLPGRDFEVIDEPMSGWAVKVSSLKTEELARQEARKILEQGYPSFITRKRIGGTNWYRVLVGPFSDKRDADRYQQLLNVTYGNDAYTVNLSTD